MYQAIENKIKTYERRVEKAKSRRGGWRCLKRTERTEKIDIWDRKVTGDIIEIHIRRDMIKRRKGKEYGRKKWIYHQNQGRRKTDYASRYKRQDKQGNGKNQKSRDGGNQAQKDKCV